MGFEGWAGEHWLEILQSVGIVGGLLFTALSLRINSKDRRVTNLFTITAHHRDIWGKLQERPELSRLLLRDIDPERLTPTVSEQIFVIMVIHHLRAAREAVEQGMLESPERLAKDVRWFFSLPIPHSIWNQVRHVQDRRFVKFVETCLGETDSQSSEGEERFD